MTKKVSVPIRGLFNLTAKVTDVDFGTIPQSVSVPIRGLFNLTDYWSYDIELTEEQKGFRPHQGII